MFAWEVYSTPKAWSLGDSSRAFLYNGSSRVMDL